MFMLACVNARACLCVGACCIINRILMDYEGLSAGCREGPGLQSPGLDELPLLTGRAAACIIYSVTSSLSAKNMCVHLCVFSERTENEVMYCFVLYLGKGHDCQPVVQQCN